MVHRSGKAVRYRTSGGRATRKGHSTQTKLSCVCAIVVRAIENDGEEVVEQALRALSESALPGFKQPRRYIFVSDLPYTANGKAQRFKLREQLRQVQGPMSNV